MADPKWGRRQAPSARNQTWLWLLAYLMAGCVGLLLLLYPLISNELYENRQDGVIQEYTTIVTDTKQDQALSDTLAAARSYNQQLATGILDADDPFLVPVLPTEDSTQKSILDVSGNGVIATLSIPKLALELPVYYGTDGETLEHGIGTLEVSSLPVGGVGTHSVLCGHSGLSSAKLFSDLSLMELGDTFYIDGLGERLAYEVDQIRTVLPGDVSQIAIDPAQDYCTLLTCTPIGQNTHRLLVRGTRVEYVEEMEPETPVTQEEPLRSVWLSEYLTSVFVSLCVVVVLAVVLLVVHFVRRRRRT